MNKKKTLRSVRARINVWYSVLMALLGLILGVALVLSQNYISVLNIHRDLVSQVEKNSDEVEYENGILEVENDFAYNRQGIVSIVLSDDGRLLAGEYSALGNNISPSSFPLPGEEDDVFKLELNGKSYFVFDKFVSFNILEFSVDAKTGEVLDWSTDSQSTEPKKASLEAKPENGASVSESEAYENALIYADIDESDCFPIGAQREKLYDIPVINLRVFCRDKLFDDLYVRGIATDDGASFFTQRYIAALSVFLPVYVAVAVLIGFWISSRAFKSVGELSEAVSSVRTLDDIKNTREVTTDSKELKELTDGFNRMLERLNRSFEAEKHFSENVSHELKTPLAVISAQCELLLDRGTLDDEAEKQVLSIKKQCRNMNKLIGDMLLFARLEQGREHFDFSVQDLSLLVRSVSEDIALISEKKMITDIPDDIILNMDVLLMTRLVENLLTNADRYGKENGSIWVTLSSDGGKITLGVRDDGLGIAPEDREKIFMRFYRVDKSRSRSFGGSGLGLSFVDEIARLHGGRVELESEPGKGSEFRIIFEKSEN